MVTLGIDTSCYTTSVCAIEDGRLISDRRTLLKEVAHELCRGFVSAAAVPESGSLQKLLKIDTAE